MGFIRVANLDYAYPNPGALSDDDLFLKLAGALSAMTTRSGGKLAPLNPGENPEPISRFASLYNEAVRRGFQRDDIGFGMRPHLDRDERLSSFGDPDWKRFEKLVARIHIALCREADVKWSEKLMDRSGTERQLDVTIRTRSGPHEVLGIIQCKYEKRPVTITEVEAFTATKQDLNAGLAIMVSRSGYQAGAEAKAKLHDVRLWTLQEAEQASWREEIRTFELRYPMFEEIQFCPAIPSDAFSCDSHRIDFGAVVIAKDGRSITLAGALAQAIHNVSERCLPLPCWFDLKFEGSTLSLLGKSFPLEKVEIHFTRYISIEQQKRMRVPLGSSYLFKQKEGKGLCIADRDLPPLPPDL